MNHLKETLEWFMEQRKLPFEERFETTIIKKMEWMTDEILDMKIEWTKKKLEWMRKNGEKEDKDGKDSDSSDSSDPSYSYDKYDKKHHFHDWMKMKPQEKLEMRLKWLNEQKELPLKDRKMDLTDADIEAKVKSIKEKLEKKDFDEDEKKKWSLEGLREKRDWLKKQMTFPLEKRVSEHLTDEVLKEKISWLDVHIWSHEAIEKMKNKEKKPEVAFFI